MEMKVIGLTGGIGAGKSMVLAYIQANYNCVTLMTDMIAYDIIRHDAECNRLVEEFFDGMDIHSWNGSIDSRKVGKIIFSDLEKQHGMNAIVHPRVVQYVREKCEEERRKDGTEFVLVESALMYESSLDQLCDKILYVHADEETRVKRLTRGKRRYSRKKCMDVMAGQMKEEEFFARADLVIDTSGSRAESYQHADDTLHTLGFRKVSRCVDRTDIVSVMAGNLR